MIDEWMLQFSAVGRMALAMGLGACIGWEREKAARPAGLRTHMTVALAASLITVLAEAIAHTAPREGFATDPTRVLEAVVTGVSFLGAGTIFASRDGSGVHGLTTAGSLLATATIATAAGVHAYVIAVSGTALLLVVLGVLRRLDIGTAKAEEAKDARTPAAVPST